MTKLINPQFDGFLTYLNNVGDDCPKTATPDILDRLIDSDYTRQLLKRYREGGDERAKMQLPAVLFNGLYVPSLAEQHMAQPTAPGEKKRSRRDNECFVPWPFFGIDIDPKEGCTLSPRELFESICRQVREAFGTEPKEVVGIAYATPTYPGLRLVVKRTKGLTIEQEQERWNAIMPLKCDGKCKNLGRLFFLTAREDLLYLNKDLLFSVAPYSLDDYPMSNELPTAKQLQGDYTDLRTATGATTTSYDEETLENIVSELEQCVGGGAAREGDRNNQVYDMARVMRQLVGPNIPLLQSIIPRYNLSPLEHLQAITNGAKAKLLANIPENLSRAIERATSQSSPTMSTTPPTMPKVLPKAVEILINPIPEKARAASAISSFAAWRALMHEVSFHYIDNLNYEPCFFCICCAHQTEGKTATRMPSECILERVQETDRINREKENIWREEVSALGANKDRPNAPQLPIRIVEADMTNPAFVKRAVNAHGYSLYTYAEELEKLHRLSGLSEIIRTAYDGGRYGQERVAANSCSQQVEHLRWSFNVSTTPQTARTKFKNDMLNGTLTRLSFSTIPYDQNDFGDEMPVYGDFGEDYKELLKPFIEQLCNASGVVVSKEAEAWVERERQRQIDALRRKDQRYMVPFMKRSLQMGFWRAMMLYIMNGYEWNTAIEDFASWSIDYDLWCKLYYFGDLIEQSTGATPDNSRYTMSLITLLPHEFTREQARNMRRDIGRSSKMADVRNMLNQWVYRGIVSFDVERNVFVKTETKKQAV